MLLLKGCTKTYLALTVLGALSAIFGGVLFPLGDYIIREEVKKKVLIADNDDSELYDVWQNNPIPVYTQYYMFDVQNVEAVLDGEKPVLKEKGPYTYREQRVKFDIVWNKNGTVTYRQNRTYHFVPGMSVGPESDMIHTLNPLIAIPLAFPIEQVTLTSCVTFRSGQDHTTLGPFTSLAQSLRYLPPTIKDIVSTVLSFSGVQSVFLHRPVQELIWGYDDPILATLHRLIPWQFKRSTVGYFIRKNYTDDGVYTVETGENDIEDLGTITRFNGKTHVDSWTTPWANMVNGTDGTVAPPFMFHDSSISVFQSDACRSLTLYYTGEVDTPQGITTRRYTMGPTNFANGTVNPNNLGFCTPQTNCLPTGLHNNTACEKPVNGVRIPVILSLPHFLYVDPSVQDSVEGLHPNDQQHDSTLDIEPWTGFTMQISKRAQINFFVEQVDGIRQMHNIRTLFFPILWMNESIVIDDKHADMAKDQLFLPLDILFGVKIGLLAVGGLQLLLAAGLFFRRRIQESKNQVCNSTLDPVENGKVPNYARRAEYGSTRYTTA